MKESDIRPKQLIKHYRQLQLQDIKLLLSQKSKFINVVCPACLSANVKLTFEKVGFFYHSCSQCQTLYVSPRPTIYQLKKYYQKSFAAKFWQTHLFPYSKIARINKIIKPRIKLILKLINKHHLSTKRLIDIGAAPGHFGQEIARTKTIDNIVLIDPAPILSDGLSNITIINDIIENVKPNIKSSLITNFELIEHLFSPDQFIECVKNILEDNGWFIFTTPNGQGFELITLNKDSDNIVAPIHLNLFNTDSIKVFLKRHGFSNIKITTPGLLDTEIVVNKHLDGDIDLKKQPFLYYLLIEKGVQYASIFQQFLRKNQLSSHMMIIAQKETIPYHNYRRL